MVTYLKFLSINEPRHIKAGVEADLVVTFGWLL